MKIDLGNISIQDFSEILMYLYDSEEITEKIKDNKISVPDENAVRLLRAWLRFDGLPDELIPEIVVKI